MEGEERGPDRRGRQWGGNGEVRWREDRRENGNGFWGGETRAEEGQIRYVFIEGEGGNTSKTECWE